MKERRLETGDGAEKLLLEGRWRSEHPKCTQGLGQMSGLTEEKDTSFGGRQALILTLAPPRGAVWPQQSSITSLSLSSLNCQVGIPSLPVTVAVGIRGENTGK